jgi:hypothetical protein
MNDRRVNVLACMSMVLVLSGGCRGSERPASSGVPDGEGAGGPGEAKDLAGSGTDDCRGRVGGLQESTAACIDSALAMSARREACGAAEKEYRAACCNGPCSGTPFCDWQDGIVPDATGDLSPMDIMAGKNAGEVLDSVLGEVELKKGQAGLQPRDLFCLV